MALSTMTDFQETARQMVAAAIFLTQMLRGDGYDVSVYIDSMIEFLTTATYDSMDDDLLGTFLAWHTAQESRPRVR